MVWMVGPGTPVMSIGLLYITPLNYRGEKKTVKAIYFRTFVVVK